MEQSARGLARQMGRRSFLARAGRVLVGGVGAAALPILPVARASGAVPDDPDGAEGDPKRCEYWRHCAIDGFACSCCGGSASACPPGSEMSPVTWIGTCRNPADGKDYVISYNDCCGKGFCGRCECNRNEGDRPDYHWVRANDINWCSGAKSQAYHCSVAIVVGEASEPQPER
ncbi:MAG: methylamine dehydrogenase light chain [Myxococcota bacterium]